MIVRKMTFAVAIWLIGLGTPLTSLSASVHEKQVTWVRFSQVMAELSQNPEFVKALLERIGNNPKAGGILGPDQIKRLRELILGKEFEALDRFPTMTVKEMGRAVQLAAAAEKPSGRKTPEARRSIAPHKALPEEEMLGIPTHGAPPDPKSLIKNLGFGLEVGEEIDPQLAAYDADSLRLAKVLNRLAVNPPASGGTPRYRVRVGAKYADTPERLIALLMEMGHDVEVRDNRYFANFGDLRYKGQDVLTPFWVDTQIRVPGTDRSLSVPVGHSQHELRVRGPKVNANLSFYFGIDGKGEFRPISTRDQGWVLKRTAHTYRPAEALEVVRLAGVIIRTYEAIQRAHPELPFGGYYALGVCNDVNAMIELHMQGKTSLYPLTLDVRLFPGEAEVERLARGLPVDGRGKSRPDLDRILGSVPVEDLSELPLPQLRRDLELVRAAWLRGEREFIDSNWKRFWVRVGILAAVALVLAPRWVWWAAVGLVAAVVAFLLVRWRRRGTAAKKSV